MRIAQSLGCRSAGVFDNLNMKSKTNKNNEERKKTRCNFYYKKCAILKIEHTRVEEYAKYDVNI
jgi:hypothetical protein